MWTKYDQETKDRVIRMFYERREEAPEESMRASFRRLRELTGIPMDTMRGWADRARVDASEKPGVTSAEREEIKVLRKELAELKRANEILKTARVDSACQCNMSKEVLHGEDGPAGDARRTEAGAVGSLARWRDYQPDFGSAGKTAGLGVHDPAALRRYRPGAAQTPPAVPFVG